MIVFGLAAVAFLVTAATIAHKLKTSDPYGLKTSRRKAAQEARG